MSSMRFSLEEVTRNKWAYLRMVYWLCGFNTLFYLVRFNFDFKVPQYNWILLPIWFLMMAVPPAFIALSKSYRAAAISTCWFATLLTSILIFLSGGIEAPGLIWLAGYPLIQGMLLGKKGALAAYILVGINLAIFIYCNNRGIGPHVIEDFGNVQVERIINLAGLILFMSITGYFYNIREEKLTARLVQKNTDVESLLRLLLHDIANTLSRMTYDLIRHKEGQERGVASTDINKIERAMDDINTLLFQVRHLKSLKDGKSALPLKGISLPMVLHELYELTEPIAQQKGIKISLEIAREKMMVSGDKTLLSNVVLMNLLTNAIKFSHPGDKIDLRAYSAKNQVYVEIQDYGVGIPPDILSNIFSLAHRTSRLGTLGEGGTGYGMPLVNEYLQLMGGRIEIFSNDASELSGSSGTLVKVTMPRVNLESHGVR